MTLIKSLKKLIHGNEKRIRWLDDKRDQIETYQTKVRTAKTVGTSSNVVGTVGAVVGVLGAPLTGGASLAITLGSLGFTAAGVTTNLITDKVDANCTEDHVSQLKELMSEHDAEAQKLSDVVEEMHVNVKRNIDSGTDSDLALYAAMLAGAGIRVVKPELTAALLSLKGSGVIFTSLSRSFEKTIMILGKNGLVSQEIKFLGSLFGSLAKGESAVLKNAGKILGGVAKGAVAVGVVFQVFEVVDLIKTWANDHTTIKNIDRLKSQLREENDLCWESIRNLERTEQEIKDAVDKRARMQRKQSKTYQYYAQAKQQHQQQQQRQQQQSQSSHVSSTGGEDPNDPNWNHPHHPQSNCSFDTFDLYQWLYLLTDLTGHEAFLKENIFINPFRDERNRLRQAYFSLLDFWNVASNSGFSSSLARDYLRAAVDYAMNQSPSNLNEFVGHMEFALATFMKILRSWKHQCINNSTFTAILNRIIKFQEIQTEYLTLTKDKSTLMSFVGSAANIKQAGFSTLLNLIYHFQKHGEAHFATAQEYGRLVRDIISQRGNSRFRPGRDPDVYCIIVKNWRNTGKNWKVLLRQDQYGEWVIMTCYKF